MNQVINKIPILFSVGVAQPATAAEASNVLARFVPNSGIVFKDTEIETLLLQYATQGYVVCFDWNKRRLFSLTEHGNSLIPKRLRWLRDKTRS